MKKSDIVAKAELNVDEVPASRISWPATTAELVTSKRESRSKKPEEIFHLLPIEVGSSQQQPQQGPSRQPISFQPQPVFEKTCEATQKNVKGHVFFILKKKRKKRTGRPTQHIASQAT